MRRKKIFVRPKLNDRKGDLNRKWYVEMSMRNPKTDEMIRRRFNQFEDISINEYNSKEERTEAANRIIILLNRKVDNGWNIFADTERCVYEDQLQYSHAAAIYKNMLSENNSYSYWIAKYLIEKVGELKGETKSTYKSRYRIFGLWLESRNMNLIDIKSINNSVIIVFFNYLKNERNLSARTYRSYSDLLSAFFDYLYDKAVIEKNPIYNLPENRNVKDMGAERIQQCHLTSIMKMLDAEDEQLAMACRFEYYCGLRPGYEVRLLKVGDIDFRKGLGKVRVTLDNSKVTRRRIVAIPDVFMDYLIDNKINEYNPDYYVFGKNGKPGPHKLGKNNMRYRFNKFRKRMNLPDEYKFYSMKHTGAIALAENGERIINIRDHLGHTNISTTEHYLKRLGFSDSEIIRKHFPAI
jgi:integrase